MKEEIDWKEELLESGRFNDQFSKGLLENGAKNYMQGVYLGFMYYRWRAMLMSPGHAYSIHKDGQPNVTNVRCHVPLITNEQAKLMFLGDELHNKNATLYHLECGKVYEVNTTQYHTAINFGSHDRWHIVGVRYEDSDYWT